jgi:hypothetical protein
MFATNRQTKSCSTRVFAMTGTCKFTSLILFDEHRHTWLFVLAITYRGELAYLIFLLKWIPEIETAGQLPCEKVALRML